ncbi:hypothetical protein MRX96_057594 [Rhipicephalus microplus]
MGLSIVTESARARTFSRCVLRLWSERRSTLPACSGGALCRTARSFCCGRLQRHRLLSQPRLAERARRSPDRLLHRLDASQSHLVCGFADAAAADSSRYGYARSCRRSPGPARRDVRLTGTGTGREAPCEAERPSVGGL